MSHRDASLVDVRTLAEHPLIEAGPAALRMVAPGSRRTREPYGLVEYGLARPGSPARSSSPRRPRSAAAAGS